MALAAPPDLSDHAFPVQPLARTYPRGLLWNPIAMIGASCSTP
jgi:hypothetical protein